MSSPFSNRFIQRTDLRQEMRINPRLYQAMELLYMPLLDLQVHLKNELAENPFLELSEPDVSQEISLDEEQEKRGEEEIDWEAVLLDDQDRGHGIRGDFEALEFMETPTVVQPNLRDRLLEQLRDLPLDLRSLRLGEEIIGNIEDSGFLGCDLPTVLEAMQPWLAVLEQEAREAIDAMEPGESRDDFHARLPDFFRPYTPEEAEALLRIIQEMDPPGVGARDVRESILIQLRARGEADTLAYTLVDEHFDGLLNHRWAEIARVVGASPRAVQEAADLIATLDPKPGRQLTPDDDPYILPDLVVEKVGDDYMVALNDTSLPRLRISRTYRDIAKDRRQFTGENRDFIASKLNAANWMVQAIEQRRQTMLRVMNFIVARQREFLEKGIQHLRPLTLREVAEHIDMHESTVSRVTNEKFVQTPRGVFPLKFFFSSGLSTATGDDISARGVRDKIRVLVQQEEPSRPLTDQRIVEILGEEGIQIARRTVAKYRDQLGVLPARMRKRV
jgi:RNA polymerase sigma-54 factor